MKKIFMIMMIAATAQFCMPNARAATDLVSSPKTRIVVIDVSDDDKVVLAASAIVSIAKHRFLLNGSQPVLEVTIDTVGNNSLRFYYTEQSSSVAALKPRKVFFRFVQDTLSQVPGGRIRSYH